MYIYDMYKIEIHKQSEKTQHGLRNLQSGSVCEKTKGFDNCFANATAPAKAVFLGRVGVVCPVSGCPTSGIRFFHYIVPVHGQEKVISLKEPYHYSGSVH